MISPSPSAAFNTAPSAEEVRDMKGSMPEKPASCVRRHLAPRPLKSGRHKRHHPPGQKAWQTSHMAKWVYGGCIMDKKTDITAIL